VDARGRLAGVVTIDEIRQTAAMDHMGSWLLAADIMVSAPAVATPAMPLRDARDAMRSLGVDYLPVVAVEDQDRLVGFLELRELYQAVAAELLKRQKLAAV